jgi:hypothetical protein
LDITPLSYLRVMASELSDYIRRAIGRTSLGQQHFEAISWIILGGNALQALPRCSCSL